MGLCDRLADLLGVPSRHDVVLGGMPPAFALTYLLGQQFLLSRPAAVAVASLASALFVVDGLFRHPPT